MPWFPEPLANWRIKRLVTFNWSKWNKFFKFRHNVQIPSGKQRLDPRQRRMSLAIASTSALVTFNFCYLFILHNFYSSLIVLFKGGQETEWKRQVIKEFMQFNDNGLFQFFIFFYFITTIIVLIVVIVVQENIWVMEKDLSNVWYSCLKVEMSSIMVRFELDYPCIWQFIDFLNK